MFKRVTIASLLWHVPFRRYLSYGPSQTWLKPVCAQGIICAQGVEQAQAGWSQGLVAGQQDGKLLKGGCFGSFFKTIMSLQVSVHAQGD